MQRYAGTSRPSYRQCAGRSYRQLFEPVFYPHSLFNPMVEICEVHADDMVFLHADKSFLHGLLVCVNNSLHTELKLSLKGNFQVFPVDARGLDFVGFRFYHTHTLIRKSIKKNFCKAVAKLNKNKKISDNDYKQRISSWLGWAKYSDSKHLLKSIIKSEIYGKLRF